ncbi:MAG: hypothetical protein WAL02_02735 [Rhodoplanes sp.]
MREAPRIAAPRAGASGCCIPITNSGIFTPRQTHSAGHWRNKRRRSEGQGFVAQLARLQARHDSIRRAFVELKQQRQRERALERTEAERLKRRYDAAWDKFIAAFTRHWDTCRKALHPSHFDPSQPRVPAGNPDGGQWTRVAGADKPRFGRGTIAAVLAEAAKRAIEAYRTGNSLWDLFGGKIGTVTVTTIDGQQVFGSNSTSPTYEAADHAAALELRDRLIEKYPDVLNAQEVGRRPNDALFHAETPCLQEPPERRAENWPDERSRCTWIGRYVQAAIRSYRSLVWSLEIQPSRSWKRRDVGKLCGTGLGSLGIGNEEMGEI